MNSPKVVLYGMFQSYYSWSYILRQYAAKMIRKNIDFGIKMKKGIGFDPNFPLSDELRERIVPRNYVAEKEIAFIHPSLYKNINGRDKIGILVYETYPLPNIWVENINKYLDLLTVPSNFVKELCIRSGVKKIITVEPLPYEILKENGKGKKEKFTFLSIATPHKRKNISFMLHGFLEAFGNNEKVEFILKTLPEKRSGKLKHWEESVTQIKNEYKDLNNIKIIDEYYSDTDIQLLLQSSDCYVQLSSSEAYGITIFQAIDYGIPVIATDYGGYVEYLKGRYSPVSYSLQKLHGLSYGPEDIEVIAAKPNWESYKNKMLLIYHEKRNGSL